jgi:hypothetical protein
MENEILEGGPSQLRENSAPRFLGIEICHLLLIASFSLSSPLTVHQKMISNSLVHQA